MCEFITLPDGSTALICAGHTRYSAALKRRISTGAHPMAFDPRKTGAPEVPAAEFWKATHKGDAVLGRVAKFGTNRIGKDEARHVVLEGACVIPKADDGVAKGYHSVQVGVNTSLAKRLSDADLGSYVAIVFAGKTDTPAGKMFTYRVFRLGTEDYAREVMAALGDSSGRDLLDATRPGVPPATRAKSAGPGLDDDDERPLDDDEDLPF